MKIYSAITRRYDIVIVVSLFLASMVADNFSLLAFMESETLGYRHILRNGQSENDSAELHQDIILVNIDEVFYQEYGKFPLTRTDLATLIGRLGRMGASVIGVDMLLDFNSAYAEDPVLQSTLEGTNNVVLVSIAEFDDDALSGLKLPIDRFADLTSQGYSNVSSYSAVRESIVTLLINPGAAAADIWPFSVQVVARHRQSEPNLDGHSLRLNQSSAITLNADYSFYIDYPRISSLGGDVVAIHDDSGFSALDILYLSEDELADLAVLIDGKIVLLGETSELALDSYQTPVGRMYGIEIIASQVSTLLNGASIGPKSLMLDISLSTVLMLIIIGSSALTKPVARYSVVIGTLSVFVILVFLLYVIRGTVLSLTYPVIAAMLAFGAVNFRHYLLEREKKRRIRRTFGQFLSPAVVADLEQHPEKLELGGEEREMTALFSDLANFSTFSEKLTPTRLVDFLNEYLSAMSNIIIAHNGTIDKFEGDAIICFWGAPSHQANHAELACVAACEMNEKLDELQPDWTARGLPQLNARIGINSGNMIVGNMGSRQRMDYTMMGDAVNLASRIEGVNKIYGSDILITRDTMNRLGSAFTFREIDTVRVLGRSAATTVFELLGATETVSGSLTLSIKLYEQGLTLYKQKDYQAAADVFSECLKINSADRPANTLKHRCMEYAKQSPDSDWDGVMNLDSK